MCLTFRQRLQSWACNSCDIARSWLHIYMVMLKTLVNNQNKFPTNLLLSLSCCVYTTQPNLTVSNDVSFQAHSDIVLVWTLKILQSFFYTLVMSSNDCSIVPECGLQGSLYSLLLMSRATLNLHPVSQQMDPLVTTTGKDAMIANMFGNSLQFPSG